MNKENQKIREEKKVKAGGNAIVPQIAYNIFRAINEFENNIKNSTP